MMMMMLLLLLFSYGIIDCAEAFQTTSIRPYHQVGLQGVQSPPPTLLSPFSSSSDVELNINRYRMSSSSSSFALSLANNNNQDDKGGVGPSMGPVDYLIAICFTIVGGFFILPFFGFDYVLTSNGRLTIGTAEEGQLQRESVRQAKEIQRQKQNRQQEQSSSSSSPGSVISADSELLKAATVQ